MWFTKSFINHEEHEGKYSYRWQPNRKINRILFSIESHANTSDSNKIFIDNLKLISRRIYDRYRCFLYTSPS